MTVLVLFWVGFSLSLESWSDSDSVDRGVGVGGFFGVLETSCGRKVKELSSATVLVTQQRCQQWKHGYRSRRPARCWPALACAWWSHLPTCPT
jgi:hypothetical protein